MRMNWDLYLIIGRLVVFVQSNAIEVDGSAEEVLLPFRPPLSERVVTKGIICQSARSVMSISDSRSFSRLVHGI